MGTNRSVLPYYRYFFYKRIHENYLTRTEPTALRNCLSKSIDGLSMYDQVESDPWDPPPVSSMKGDSSNSGEQG